MDSDGWVELAQYWGALKNLANRRHRQKCHFRSSNLWTARHTTHFYGLCGEAIVAMLTGWKVDRSLRVNGDRGYDFEENGQRYDVKTATHWQDPHLKEFSDKPLKADKYILVALNVKCKRGRVIGWASKEQVKTADLRDYGHGPMLSIPGASLIEWDQFGLPVPLAERDQ